VTTAEPLTEEEVEEFKKWLSGQYSDGWGEGFGQLGLKDNEGPFVQTWWDGNDPGYSWYIKQVK